MPCSLGAHEVMQTLKCPTYFPCAGTLTCFLFAACLGHATCPPNVSAETLAQIPILAAVPTNDKGAMEVVLIHWDQMSSPDPLALRWDKGRINLLRGIREDITFVNEAVQSFQVAMQLAVERTPTARHTGTCSILGFAYAPTTSDGPSAGAVFAVGFIAAFKGEKIRPGVALTGTIDASGKIGPVGGIPDKVRAAAREGYHKVLIPRGQLYDDPRWDLPALAAGLRVTVEEVESIDEAYELMTGSRLS